MANENEKLEMDDDSETQRGYAREVAKKLGLFAAYTAPAMLAMVYSGKAAAVVIDSGSTG